MSGRVALVLVALAVSIGLAGCGGPRRLTGAPPPVPRDAFVYKPIERPVARPVPVAPPPRVPLRLPEQPRLPDTEPGWAVDGSGRPWRWIVLHHSATDRGSASVFDDWHRNGRHWDELGYHFVIGNGSCSGDGQVEIGSRWPKQKHGAHCRVGNNEEYNDFGIGVCLVGDFQKHRPSRAQLSALVRLVDYLATRFRVNDAHIIGHGQVDDTRCPGRYFPYDEFFSMLAQRRAARGAVPLGR